MAQVIPIKIEDEMRVSFMDYSMSVIVSRALPDVRDGLKPVHRRILYTMHELKNFFNKPYLKSARIVGDVMGKYHPHGDGPIYDALVRMAQEFSMRYPLIDGQGNFGSLDGDSPAAMRYTESRLQELTQYLLQNIELGTVDFVPNYDNKDVEPTVLPASYPQLLVNGSSGIAVGMATNIPPHNMCEVLDGLIAVIGNPKITTHELMHIIKGPDFPTAGEIHGTKGILEAYETGRGSVVVRAKTCVEEVHRSGGVDRQRIVVTQVPYQVNKARLIEKIAELVTQKKIEGISDLRDESSKDGVRIVIDIKRDDDPQVVLNHLYKHTQLQTSFGMNFVALVKGMPKLLSLKEILKEFYYHRREVVIRKTSFLLKKNKERLHILEGLKIAVEQADRVIAVIRGAGDTATAHDQLCSLCALTSIQAKAVLDMRLAKLTALERDKIATECAEVEATTKDLQNILDTPERVTGIILDEIKVLKETFHDARRTVILSADADGFHMTSLIPNEEVAVTVSYAGYVKRTALMEISAQKRGGKGRSGMLTKNEDIVQNVFVTSNHQSLLCFTNLGKVYNLMVYQVPEAPLRSRGKHFANLIQLETGERVVSVLPIAQYKEGAFIVSVTEHGYIKKTDLMAYASVRVNGIIGLKLDDGDTLIGCALVEEGDDILMASRLGKAIRFHASYIRDTTRATRGVLGMRVSEDNDSVIAFDVVKPQASSTILSVCANGYGKRTDLAEYHPQARGGKGVFTIKVNDRNGQVVGIAQLSPQDQVVLMTSAGKITRFNVDEISVVGRLTQGVRLMKMDEGEHIMAISRVSKELPEEMDSSEPEVPGL